MRIRFEATCDIPDDIRYADDFLQLEFNKLQNNNVKNIDVISAHEEKIEPKNVIEGEPCPICGFNGEMKIINLTDEYVEAYCPQCHNKVKIKIVE